MNESNHYSSYKLNGVDKTIAYNIIKLIKVVSFEAALSVCVLP